MLDRPAVLRSVDLVAVTSLYLIAVWVVQTPLFVHHPDVLGPAVAVDLVLTASVLHLLLGVRGGGLPSWTVPVVALAGGLVAGQLLPAGSGSALWWGVGLVALAELAVGATALWRLRTVLRETRAARARGATALDALEEGLARALESRWLAAAVVAELRLVSLGVFGVFRRPDDATADAFTVHRTSGAVPLAAALVGVGAIEVPVAHWALDAYVGGWLAWPITVLSVYGLLWLWGDAQAMRLYPVLVRDGRVTLRVGLRWTATFDVADVIGVARATEPAEVDLSLISGPDVEVALRRPVELRGPLGITRTADRFTMSVDDPDGFVRALQTP